MRKEVRHILFHCLLPLLVSLLIYLFFRPQSVVVNRFAQLLMPAASSAGLRFTLYAPLVYSLPGALWMYSFLSSIKHMKAEWLGYRLIPLLVALGIEVAQALGVTDGTFDWYDVWFYVMAWLLFMLIEVSRNKPTQSGGSPSFSRRRKLVVFVFFLGVILLSDVWP
jgi:hypothetical protein